MERLKNMGLKKAFFVLSACCVLCAFFLLGLVFFLFQAIKGSYSQGGIVFFPDGTMQFLPTPTPFQQTLTTILDVTLIVCCLLFPLAGLASSILLFYRLKLKSPIESLQIGIAKIQNNDLDFTLKVQSTDELGRLCDAFETMREGLLRSNRQLWQQAEERKRLNAAFSHDLRNPITVLKGSIKLLRQGIDDEQTIARLEGYAQRIEQYVEAMSQVQRLEALQLQVSVVPLGVLHDEIQDTLRLLAPSKETTFCGEKIGSITIDHGSVLTVIENLIGNAARFTANQLSVQMMVEKETLYIHVLDDGPGFPTTLIQNGPQPFATVHHSSGHFGMGLYTSQLLCEKHEGQLILQNRTISGAMATAIFHLYDKT